jgi:organic hydroperoxide reductase OsmC/OhrA
MSDPAALDPEEALVAALSSCHMLFFLSIAAQRGLVVDRYVDHAVGLMEKDGDGKMAITRITLAPAITFSGELAPDVAQLDAIHHAAHQRCYIANSIKAEVIIKGPN